MRGAEAIASRPWGERFLRALEPLGGSGGRVLRGKHYALAGAVEGFRLEGSGGGVVAIARVTGRARPWYEVRLEFAALGQAEGRRVLGLVGSDASWLGRLGAGEFPLELDRALDREGLSLAPSDFRELGRSCECPDRGDPCKHMVALYCALAAEVDRDPLLLFRLRGLGLARAWPSWRYRLVVDEPRTRAGVAAAGRAPARFRLGMGARGPALALAWGPERFVPLRDAVAAFGDLGVLEPLKALSTYLPEIEELGWRKRITLDAGRLASFLRDAMRELERLGAELRLPKALRRELDPKLALAAWKKGEGNLRTYLDLRGLLAYDWRVSLGGELLALDEFRRLLRSGRRIVALKQGYAILDPEEGARLLAEAESRGGPTVLEALAERLAGGSSFAADAEALVASLFREREASLPRSLAAALRPYQERGFRWIWSNFEAGFGCVLADDMGLGKTVQAIAVLAKLAESGLLDDGALIVAPAALLENWRRELARFAPTLCVVLYHGPGRSLPSGVALSLTSYDTAARDAAKLAAREFSALVVDEAQLAKNCRARRHRAIAGLRAARRLALSGTPVENRLEDLRAVFDLVLPGYLGTAARFRERWRKPIEAERDAEAAASLRRVVAPFLLRRLKTDRSIIADLPEKLVVTEYARLAPEQAALYESIVERGLARLRAAGPEDVEARIALVLSLIRELKQVCDHPRVYDGASPPEARLSGKCLLLLELLRQSLARGEKAIVFSQYVTALRLLSGILERELGEESLLYHGGLGQEERSELVDAFQSEARPRVMLASLRAGGLGLNLTAANRVFHFDLWFNPAVEDQATDRAYRIGQARDVFVHRLVTAGTFEEKIDAMLAGKRELAGLAVRAAERELAELGYEELREIFER